MRDTEIKTITVTHQKKKIKPMNTPVKAPKMQQVTRYHPDNTIPKGADWIWVFGSNLAGRHGDGAAKVARVNFRADYGTGRGPTGQAYAIPTKDKQLKVIALRDIETSIADFIQYANLYPEKQFFVTRVGCGLAGYSDDEIGPLFTAAPANCSLPMEWKIYAAQPASV